MSMKNKMFIFGLHSTSDDWPGDVSDKCEPKCKKKKKNKTKNKNKKGPQCHQKIKCSFLDYVQLLMQSE